MKNNRTILLILTLVFAIILYLLFSLQSSTRPNLPPDDLLISNPSFPTKWNSGEIPVHVVNWQQTDKSHNSTLVSLASSMSGRSWTSDGGINIFETVLLFNNPIESFWNFWIRRPEIVRFGDWPNFTYGCDNCYFDHWDHRSTDADQEHIVCGLGGEDSCQVFYDWARYGQYIVLIELSAPNQGADNETFSSIVNEIDRWVSLKLNPGQLTD